MKLHFTRENFNRMTANIVVVLVGISFYFMLQNLDTFTGFFGRILNILEPFVIGFVLAFLLNTPVNFFDRKLAPVLKKQEMCRAVSVFLSMMIFFLIIAVLIAAMLPQLIDSTGMLIRNIQEFSLHINQYLDTWFADFYQEYDIDPALYNKFLDTWQRVLEMGSALLLNTLYRVLGLSGQITNWVVNLFVAIIVCIYLLTSREKFFAQCRKMIFALFHQPTVDRILYVTRLTAHIFNRFINGKLLDSFIIGIICFVCMTLLNMPYAMLISVIIGVTNIIPFFGPFLGAIPSVFIILIVNPVQAVWFVVFVLILQQIDGNIIGPKILGNSTGLPAVWVIFAILIGGGLGGFVGMVVGVPTVAVLYVLFKSYICQRLENRNLPSATADYMSADVNPYQKAEEKQDATESVGTDS